MKVLLKYNKIFVKFPTSQAKMQITLLDNFHCSDPQYNVIANINSTPCIVTSHGQFISILNFNVSPVIIPTFQQYILASNQSNLLFALDVSNSLLYQIVNNQLQKLQIVDTQEQQILLFSVINNEPVVITSKHVAFPLRKQTYDYTTRLACLHNEQIVLLNDLNQLIYIQPQSPSQFVAQDNDVQIQNIVSQTYSPYLLIQSENKIYIQDQQKQRALLYTSNNNIVNIEIQYSYLNKTLMFSVQENHQLNIFQVISGNSATQICSTDESIHFYKFCPQFYLFNDVLGYYVNNNNQLILQRDVQKLQSIKADQKQLIEQLSQELQQLQLKTSKQQNVNQNNQIMIPFQISVNPSVVNSQQQVLITVNNCNSKQTDTLIVELPENAPFVPILNNNNCMLSNNLIQFNNFQNVEFLLQPTEFYKMGSLYQIKFYQINQLVKVIDIQPFCFYKQSSRIPDSVQVTIECEIDQDCQLFGQQLQNINLVTTSDFLEIYNYKVRACSLNTVIEYFQYLTKNQQSNNFNILNQFNNIINNNNIFKSFSINLKGFQTRINAFCKSFCQQTIDSNNKYNVQQLQNDCEIMAFYLKIDYNYAQQKFNQGVKLLSSNLENVNQMAVEILSQLFIQ